MATYVYTSCTFSYLNRARVMAYTLVKHNPSYKVILVLVDRAPAGFYFDIRNEPFTEVIWVDQLFEWEVDQWLFQHDIVEACTAVKARAATNLLSRDDCDFLFYFDPDIAIFSPLAPVIDEVGGSSIGLTPHQIIPESRENRRSIIDNEIASLKYGSFNLGFLALRNSLEARRFAGWWDERLLDWCHDRTDNGLFVDQKWCDLVPSFFDGVRIIRHAGCNVASWNLNHRKLSFDSDGRALVNGSPLIFFHFTKLGAVGDAMTTRYAGGNVEVYELWWWYSQQVKRMSESQIPRGWWQYAFFANGVPVPKEARELYRENRMLQERYPQPFADGANSFYSYLLENTSVLQNVSVKRGFLPV